jgi:NitT/TauT family transport system permease protein
MKRMKFILALVFIILAWLVLSLLLDSRILPSPIEVFKNLGSIFIAKIAVHAGMSLWRIFAGMFLAAAIGMPLGLAMGYYARLDQLLSPIVYFIYPIPKIALIPVVMLVFGLGEAARIVMIAIIVLFQIIVAARDAVRAIPGEIYQSLRALGSTSRQIFAHAVFPASLPGLFTSLRVGLGTAVSVLFFTETFGTRYGMGFFIMDAWFRVSYTEMYSGILVLSIVGFGLFLAVDISEKRFCAWRDSS